MRDNIKTNLIKKTFTFLESLAKISKDSYSFVGPYDPREAKRNKKNKRRH